MPLVFPDVAPSGVQPVAPGERHLHTRAMDYGEPYYDKGTKMVRSMCSCGFILDGKRVT